MVEKYTPEKLVSGVINLVTLPEICRKINLIMADPDHSRHDIESLVSQDPALTMRILRIVNSSYYALPRKIDRVDQAISIIGEDDLSNLILATSATTVLKRLANPLIDFQEFWRHSVECGLMARAIAKQSHHADCEALFTSGLLHDVGKIVLYYQLPDLARAVLDESKMTGCRIEEAEQRLLSFNHAQVGGALARAWRLPEILCRSVAFHHQPNQAEAFAIEAGMVHIANVLSNRRGPLSVDSSKAEIEGLGFDPQALELIGLSMNKLLETVEAVQEQSKEVQTMMCSGS